MNDPMHAAEAGIELGYADGKLLEEGGRVWPVGCGCHCCMLWEHCR